MKLQTVRELLGEASPSVAEVVGAARLVVQNGLGYDTYMDRIEAAFASRERGGH